MDVPPLIGYWKYGDFSVCSLLANYATYGPIHCSIYASALGSEVALIPVAYDARIVEIGLRDMDICRCY